MERNLLTMFVSVCCPSDRMQTDSPELLNGTFLLSIYKLQKHVNENLALSSCVEMPGHPIADVDRRKIDPKHLCPECKDLLKNPVQTIACGHHYCDTCVKDRFG